MHGLAELSAALEDWKAVLESAEDEQGRLDRELAAINAELRELRTEAADEVERGAEHARRLDGDADAAAGGPRRG